MTISKPDLPRSAWWTVAKRTGYAVMASALASLFLSYLIMLQFAHGVSVVGLMTAFVMPVALGGPLIFYLVLQQQMLRLANERLVRIASTDSLTGCLNRGTFTASVDERATDAALPECGALLVIDADDFKQVNDRFGHDLGDHALQQIAAAIRATVRRHDLDGRIGGEEFAVLLSGADYAIANRVAERIRRAVNAIVFAPGGVPCPLSVSIGGALFARPTPFMALYRQADQRLYEAKHLGRDRVAMLPNAA
jgi:diguanylate cyclase (GGDEF)-like protein